MTWPNEPQTLRSTTPWGELILQIRVRPPRSASLILEGTFLMHSESGASERALATRGLELLRSGWGGERDPDAPQIRPRVLVGGLGLGITLAEVVRDPDVRQVCVVEVFEPLIEWNRRHLGFLNRGALDDSRVSCQVGDLLELTPGDPESAGMPGPFDLLLLDIDNGPTWLSLPSNAGLYAADGLRGLLGWIAPGGLAVFWAQEPASDFETSLAGMDGIRWRREAVVWHPSRDDRQVEDFLYFVSPSTG